MTGQLNDLYFGLYGYGKVLTAAGLFAVRDGASSFHYIPTDHLWSAFDGHPDLDDVLFALHELVLGLAHERMDFRTGKDRQKWSVEALRTGRERRSGDAAQSAPRAVYCHFGGIVGGGGTNLKEGPANGRAPNDGEFNSAMGAKNPPRADRL
jgi:hypothetical protein